MHHARPLGAFFHAHDVLVLYGALANKSLVATTAGEANMAGNLSATSLECFRRCSVLSMMLPSSFQGATCFVPFVEILRQG